MNKKRKTESCPTANDTETVLDIQREKIPKSGELIHNISMNTIMNCSPDVTIHQMRHILQASGYVTFKYLNTKETYEYIRKVAWNTKYKYKPKKEKGIVVDYLSLVTGYSDSHIKRLVSRAVRGKLHSPKSKKTKTSYKRVYTDDDIKLLAEFDRLSVYPNGVALQEYLRRMYEEFNDDRFVRLAHISHGHIYNLRKGGRYQRIARQYEHTHPVAENQIGIREKPLPNGKPGYIRVDSVHGGDSSTGEKGVYYVNFIDEVTQFEMVVCVKGISQRYLKEVWEDIIHAFPFNVINFHSDNGSEFINKVVADILNRLHITQTKSRPRRHNDNGLVESKNGWVVRKHFGYLYVHSAKASLINTFLQQHFNEYLDYHRPCAFPSKIVDSKGKVKVTYRKQDYKTPYDKLKQIDPKGNFLQNGVSYKKLDRIAYRLNDFDFLRLLDKQKKLLLKTLDDQLA